MRPALRRDSFLKLTAAALLGGVLMLSGCKDKAAGPSGKTAGSGGAKISKYEVVGDYAIGNPDAPVTVVEYASVTCVHCAGWHESVWPEMRKLYIDTGKVRFIYREFPTSPVSLAEAGFMIARCADDEKYFANIALQYEKQKELMAAAQDGRAREAYGELARAAGLNDAQYEACLTNEAEYEAMQKVIKGGFEKGVSSTPSFFINGELKPKIYKIEEFETQFSAFFDVPKREKETASDDAKAATVDGQQ